MQKLEITDRFQLLALHKVIMEAKFHDNPDNNDILGSPHVAELANNVINVLKNCFPEGKGLTKDDWEKWQPAEQHERIINVIKKRLYSDNIWQQIKDKEQFIKVVFAPLKVSEEFVQSLINEINENNP